VLTQITLAIGYFGAGAAKLVLGGTEWFNGYTLQGIMLGHDGDWSRAFAGSVAWCRLQSVGVVLVQALFPLVLVWPRSRWFFLPMATLFHLMTWKTMDTGPYMRVWLLLFAFVPMERIPDALHRWLTGGAARAAVTVLAAAAYATAVFASSAHDGNVWLAATAGAFLLAAFAWHVARSRAAAATLP